MSKDIKTKTDKELEKMLAETREDLRKFNFNIYGSGIKNVRQARTYKTQIARNLTEINIP